MDSRRLAHVAEQTVVAMATDDHKKKNLIHALRNDPSVLRYSPMSFLTVVAGSKEHDEFSMSHLVPYFNHFLGLPMAPLFSQTAICGCNQPFDTHGHHKLTCITWTGSAMKRSHDKALGAMCDVLRTMGHDVSVKTQAVPCHTEKDRHQADILVDRRSGGFNSFVGDLTITHPATGTGLWGASDNAMQTSYRAKVRKHQDAYAKQHVLFLPLVASTYGGLHPDFLKCLWWMTDTSHVAVDTGEVRQMYGKGDAALKMRKLLFAKACARMGCAVARAAAGRLLGYAGPGTLHPFARQQGSGWNRYDASDPYFLDVAPIIANSMGHQQGALGTQTLDTQTYSSPAT